MPNLSTEVYARGLPVKFNHEVVTSMFLVTLCLHGLWMHVSCGKMNQLSVAPVFAFLSVVHSFALNKMNVM